MANNNDKNSFVEGIKKGAGCAIGAGIVCGLVGFCIGGPGPAWAGFKIGLGAGSLSS